MIKSSLYSIGHGHKTMEEFISELQSFNIQFLIDVRSSPYSKWSPHFNQDNIELFLGSQNIKYIYMGDSVGGRPHDDFCYDENGYFDYQKMAASPQFISGLQRLIKANSLGYKVAIMCSESDPSQCHRSKLIGRELYFGNDINMQHIIAKNEVIMEEEIIIELTKGSWDPNLLFNDYQPYFKSRKSYKNDSESEEI